METVIEKPKPPVNRLLDATLFFTEQEAQFKVQNPLAKTGDRDTLTYLKQQYENVIAGFRRTRGLTGAEKDTLQYLRHEVRRINAKLNPTILNTVIHFKPVNWLINQLLDRQYNYNWHDKRLAAHEKNSALDYNSAELHQSLREAGFTVSIEGPLKRLMAHRLPAFSIRYVQPSAPNTDFVLHFEKIPGTEVYYFKQYDATARPNLKAILRNDPKAPRIAVSMNDSEQQLSARQAALLVNGRPVQAPHDKLLWRVADPFSPTGIAQRHFNVDNALADWPIKELNSSVSRQALVQGLRAGEAREITLLLPGKLEEKLKVAISSDAQKLLSYSPDDKLIDASKLIKDKINAHQLHLHGQTLQMKQESPDNKKRTPRVRA